MTDEQLRTYARLGALEMCRRAVTEFPDILADLKAMALVNGHPPTPNPAREMIGYMRTAQAQGVLPIPGEVKQVRQLFLDAAVPARRTMSAEARAKISAGMKRRWKLRGAR